MTQEEKKTISSQIAQQQGRLQRMDELEGYVEFLQNTISVLEGTDDKDFDVDWSHTISTLKGINDESKYNQVKKAFDCVYAPLIKTNVIEQLKDTLRLVNQEIEDL